MSITPTQLRANLYQLLDQVIETNVPLEIIKNGQLLQISLVRNKMGNLTNLKPHPHCINGDPESLVQVDWSDYWQGDKEL